MKKIMHFNLYWSCNAFLMKHNHRRGKGGARALGGPFSGAASCCLQDIFWKYL